MGSVGDKKSREGLWLALGFFMFGFALSWTAALTQQEGAGVALLTGFFSFVGGTFLSFAGFRLEARKKASDESKPESKMLFDTRRFGAALFALSFGVTVGGPTAYLLRTAYLPQATEEPALRSEAAQSEARLEGTRERDIQGKTSLSSSRVYQGVSANEVMNDLRAYILQRKLLEPLAKQTSIGATDDSIEEVAANLIILLKVDPNYLLQTLQDEGFADLLKRDEIRSRLILALKDEREALTDLSTGKGR